MNTIQTLAITWPEFMDALTYQLTGMIVVFCCLSMLCIILSISGAVAVRLDAKKKAAAEVVAAIAAAVKVTVGNEAKILDIKPIDGSYAQSGRTSIMNSHNITRG